MQPLEFDAALREHTRRFVKGTRQWVFDEVNQWRSEVDAPPVLVLLAGPGFGKTAIVSRIHQKMREKVIAIHLCHHKDSGKRDPRRMIVSLAYQLSVKFAQLREALEDVRKAEGKLRASSINVGTQALADRLLFEPLAKLSAPIDVARDGRFLIIIDALDEAEHSAKNVLLELVARDFTKLPEWLALLVTARPDIAVRKKLARLRPTVLDAAERAVQCNADVRIFVSDALGQTLDEHRLEAVVARIASKSGGLFLYLHEIRKELESGDFSVDALPDGLAGVYASRFRTLYPDGLSDDVRRVIEVLVAAPVRVHIFDELPGFVGLDKSKVNKIIYRLSQYFLVGGDDRISVFHKSLIDWITGREGYDRRYDDEHEREYYINHSAAHRHLASACGATLVLLLDSDALESDRVATERLYDVFGNSNLFTAPREYALRWIITHLVSTDNLEETALAILSSLGFILMRAENLDELILDTILMLPQAELLRSALVLSRGHLSTVGPTLLVEELWQRLLAPAQAQGANSLAQLASDARCKAQAELPFSARDAYLQPADSPLRAILVGHGDSVDGIVSFNTKEGAPRLASWSDDMTIRIWDPIVGGDALHVFQHNSSIGGVVTFIDHEGAPFLASWCRRYSVESVGYFRIDDDALVRVWDPIVGGDVLHVFEHVTNTVDSVKAFFVHGDNTPKLAVSSSWESPVSRVSGLAISIWDPIAGGDALRVIKGDCGLAAFVDRNGTSRHIIWCANNTVRNWTSVAVAESNSLHVLWIPACDKNRSRSAPSRLACRDLTAAFVDRNGAPQLATVTTEFFTLRSWCELSIIEDEADFVCKVNQTVEIRVWDAIAGGDALHVLEWNTQKLARGVLAFIDRNNEPRLASWDSSSAIHVWDPIAGGAALRILRGHSRWVTNVKAFMDRNGVLRATILSSDPREERLRIWDLTAGDAFFPELNVAAADVAALVDYNGTPLYAQICCNSRAVQVWNLSVSRSEVEAIKPSRWKFGVYGKYGKGGNSGSNASVTPEKPDGLVIQTLEGHQDMVTFVAAFIDGNGAPRLASCSRDKTIRVWDPLRDWDSPADARADNARHILWGYNNGAASFATFANRSGAPRVATWTRDFGSSIHVWDPITGGDAIQIRRLNFGDFWVESVAAFADRDGLPRLACCLYYPPAYHSNSHIIKELVVVETPNLLNGRVSSTKWDTLFSGSVFTGRPSAFFVVAFRDRDGSPRLASPSQRLSKQDIYIWDPIAGGTALHELRFVCPVEVGACKIEHTVGIVAFVDRDRAPRLASQSASYIIVWDPIAGNSLHFFDLDQIGCACVAFNDPDGAPRLATCVGSTVRVLDPIAGGDALHVLEGHTTDVRGVVTFVDCDGAPRLASWSGDETIRIWDVIAGSELTALEGKSCCAGVMVFVDHNGAPRLASWLSIEVSLWDPIAGGAALYSFQMDSAVITIDVIPKSAGNPSTCLLVLSENGLAFLLEGQAELSIRPTAPLRY